MPKCPSLVVRSLSGLVYVLLMVAACLVDIRLLAAVMLLMETLCMREFWRMTAPEGLPKILKYPALLSSWLLFAAAWQLHGGLPAAAPLLVAALTLIFLILPLSLHFVKQSDWGSIAFLYAAILYIGLPFALTAYLYDWNGFFRGILLLSLMIIIWAGDTGAYTLGMAFGQKADSRKLCPAISPKKSWWGVAGGILFSLAAGAGLYFTGWLHLSWYHCLGLSLVIEVAGVYGDLFESSWKRRAGLKDSGHCIPGHGGMLDRLDSALAAIPAAALYLFFVLGL